MTYSRYNEHTTQLFIENKILPLDKILKQGKLIFMHSIFYNYAPQSFRNVWNHNEDRPSNINLRNDNHFKKPHPRIELFKRFPLYSLPDEWNKSEELMFYSNQFTFKRALCDRLFDEIEANH